MKHKCPENWILTSEDGEVKECQVCGEVEFSEEILQDGSQNYEYVLEISSAYSTAIEDFAPHNISTEKETSDVHGLWI